MTETQKISLPFHLEFGLEDLSGRADLRGPYQVVKVSPTEIVVAVTATIGGVTREFRDKLTLHDPHPRGRANWQAAAKQLGLTP